MTNHIPDINNYSMKKILVVFGTRPELIKLYSIIDSDKLKKNMTVCNTGQHKEMVNGLLKIFKIQPDINLQVMKKKQPLTILFHKIFNRLNTMVLKSKPKLIIVHGDTVSAAASSLVGFYNKINVFHVEAGLRTYNIHSPYPEELNRQLISRVANMHFAPTEYNKKILLSEKVSGKILVTGNTVLDSLKLTLKKIHHNMEYELSRKLKFNFNKKFVLITTHRREILGKNLTLFLKSIKKLSSRHPNINFLYVLHKNPIAREPVIRILKGKKNIFLIDHLDYDEFSLVLNKSYFIVTDSGGLQEEGPFLKKPVIVVRPETERVEALKLGTVKLVGYNFKLLESIFENLILDKKKYKKMISLKHPYGNGNATKKIESVILKSL